MTGTAYNPNNTISTGKDLIVSIVLPDVARSIVNGTGANPTFNHFTNLKSFNGVGLTSIGNIAFRGCENLIMAELPAGITSIGTQAFMGCTNLVLTKLPKGITAIGEQAFSDCTNLKSTELPAGITSIGTAVFMNCTSLTELKSTTLNSIGSNAFQGCTSLIEVNFPAVTIVNLAAFISCTSLNTVNIPMATSLGNSVFSNSQNHLTITLGANAPVLGTTVFGGGVRTVNVRVPIGATGYGVIPGTYNNTDNTTQNWGNALRGMGWNGTEYLGGTVGNFITVNIVYDD